MYHTPVARARIARTRRGRHRGDRYMRVVRPLLIPIALFSAARRRTRFRAVGCGRLHASHAGDAGRPAGRRLAHVAPDVRPSGAQPARPDQHDQRRRPAAGVGLDDAGGPSGDDAARARWDDVPRRAMRLCRGARRPRLHYPGGQSDADGCRAADSSAFPAFTPGRRPRQSFGACSAFYGLFAVMRWRRPIALRNRAGPRFNSA